MRFFSKLEIDQNKRVAFQFLFPDQTRKQYSTSATASRSNAESIGCFPRNTDHNTDDVQQILWNLHQLERIGFGC